MFDKPCKTIKINEEGQLVFYSGKSIVLRTVNNDKAIAGIMRDDGKFILQTSQGKVAWSTDEMQDPPIKNMTID